MKNKTPAEVVISIEVTTTSEHVSINNFFNYK